MLIDPSQDASAGENAIIHHVVRQQKEFGGTLEDFKSYFGDRLPEYIQDLKEHLDRGKPQATRQANGEWLLDD